MRLSVRKAAVTLVTLGQRPKFDQKHADEHHQGAQRAGQRAEDKVQVVSQRLDIEQRNLDVRINTNCSAYVAASYRKDGKNCEVVDRDANVLALIEAGSWDVARVKGE